MSTITVSIPQPPITALVFEGGGIKGLVYAGALQALEEKNLLKDIKYVAGSSAGAMTALMVALGYTQAEIEQELKTIDFSQFKDHSPSWFGTVGQTINGIRNLFGLKRGYYRGEKLYEWVKTIIEKKLGSSTATFNDLHQKTTIKNSTFKDLFVTATNTKQQTTDFFSYEERGDAPIADVVLASMSIPLFFQARYMDSNYHIDWNPTQAKIKLGVLVPYVDGGFLDNDPIGVFQKRNYWPPGYFEWVAGKPINPSALNFRVDSSEEINALWGKPNNPIFKIFAWLKNLFINAPLSDNNKLNDYGMVTIPIPDCDISTTKFSLTEEEKEDLKRSGKDAALYYIKQKRDGAAYTIIEYQTIEDLQADYQLKQKIKLDLSKLETLERNNKEHLAVLTLECKAMEEALLAQNVQIPTVQVSESVKYCCEGNLCHKLNTTILKSLSGLVVRSETDEKQIQQRGEKLIARPVHSENCSPPKPPEVPSNSIQQISPLITSGDGSDALSRSCNEPSMRLNILMK